MYDPTFGPTSLERHLRKGDFHNNPPLSTAAGREAAVSAAVAAARNGLAGMTLTRNDMAGRTIYQLADLSSELVLRKAVQNLRKISNTRQANRLDIVRRLHLFCEEGMPFCIGKFDIRQFYQSVDQLTLKELITRRLATSPSTRIVLTGFLDRCAALGVTGLPPGLAVSAALSEFYMQDFDSHMRSKIRAHLYARYVDDIIVVLPPASNIKALRKDITKALPTGLKLNPRKSRVISLSDSKKLTPAVEAEFDYLGFKFHVFEISKTQSPHARQVTLDISPSKVKKRKTRMVRSVLQYIQDGNFGDLRDRFKLVTCNYRFFDHQKAKYRLAGARHTYGLIDLPSEGLKELDSFQRKLLLRTTGKIGAHLSATLTRAQRRELLRMSSTKGYENNVHFHFPPERLKTLMDCWKYA